MKSSTEEKHHHHHQPGSHRHKKKSSKSNKQLQQSAEIIPQDDRQIKPENESASTFDKDTFSNNISGQAQYANQPKKNKVFTLAQMADMVEDTFYEDFKRDIAIEKKQFIKQVQADFPEYIKKYEENFPQSDANSGRFRYNDAFDNNLNNLLSDNDYKNFSMNDSKDNNKNNYFNDSFNDNAYNIVDDSNNNNNLRNINNSNNILNGTDSSPIANDDYDAKNNLKDLNDNDNFNIIDDDSLTNRDKPKDQSKNSSSVKKKRRKKIKNIDSNNSSNTTNPNKLETNLLLDPESKESGEITPNFSQTFDSLDDSTISHNIPKDDNKNVINDNDINITEEEESGGEGFSSDTPAIQPANSLNRPPLNTSSKFKLFDFEQIDKNEDDPSTFNDLI